MRLPRFPRNDMNMRLPLFATMILLSQYHLQKSCLISSEYKQMFGFITILFLGNIC